MIKSIVNNSSFSYIITRYITYGIQFLNSIIIAVSLGPLYLGIWGFLNLIIQYLTQMNFGISHSVNTIAAIHKNKQMYISKITSNALILTTILCSILVFFFMVNSIFELNFGAKYNFSTYSLQILLIIVLTYFNSLLSNILRIYNKLLELAISQSILPILTLITLFFFDKGDLLVALVWSSLLAAVISFIINILRFPIKVNFNFNIKLSKKIQKKGWHLFVYNSSFYLILISTRWFVSYYYDVVEFGYFTFSFSLASVLILLLDSLTFLVWPKLLNRLAKLNNFESNKLILNVRKIYTLATHCLLHIGIGFFPYFLLLFPRYDSIFTTFSLISLTIVVFTNSFGYQALLIARGKEKIIGRFSFVILLFNILLCYLLVYYLEVRYDYIILSTLLSYLVYIVLITFEGRKTLGLSLNISEIFLDFFPIGIFIPYFISLFLVVIKVDYYFYVIPLIVYIILNFKLLIDMKDILKKIFTSPDFFKI